MRARPPVATPAVMPGTHLCANAAQPLLQVSAGEVQGEAVRHDAQAEEARVRHAGTAAAAADGATQRRHQVPQESAREAGHVLGLRQAGTQRRAAGVPQGGRGAVCGMLDVSSREDARSLMYVGDTHAALCGCSAVDPLTWLTASSTCMSVDLK